MNPRAIILRERGKRSGRQTQDADGRFSLRGEHTALQISDDVAGLDDQRRCRRPMSDFRSALRLGGLFRR